MDACGCAIAAEEADSIGLVKGKALEIGFPVVADTNGGVCRFADALFPTEFSGTPDVVAEIEAGFLASWWCHPFTIGIAQMMAAIAPATPAMMPMVVRA